ncbi:MAG: TPM domain-containing protein [Bacteroidetes bacterium]|nr:TPM domain-containing protein [Bacteroidota bacterium]
MKTITILISALIVCCYSCGSKKKEIKTDTTTEARPLFPKPTGYVNDFEKLLTAEQVKYLDSIIRAHEKQTTNQVVIATMELDSSFLQIPNSIDSFSLKLFNEWGVGTKEKNNGIGILVSANLRKMRIETGKGLTTKLTNDEAAAILKTYFFPRFKEQDYFGGLRDGVQAIMKEIQ